VLSDGRLCTAQRQGQQDAKAPPSQQLRLGLGSVPAVSTEVIDANKAALSEVRSLISYLQSIGLLDEPILPGSWKNSITLRWLVVLKVF
jgi:hypothetical protein